MVEGTAGQWWAEALGFRPVRTIVRQVLVLADVDGPDGSRWEVEVPAGYRLRRLRAAEAESRSQALKQRVVVAVHEESGEVAGFTETCVHPRRPDWGYQRDTAVLAAHRGHGLGRCLKADMARWLVADCPALERISTTTGAENTHMIRVNEAVGYVTLRSMIAMQLPVGTERFNGDQ
ncbi:GNAT family N-acetyltransferase [Amycolatopsis sp. YIM 10]|uniref:GNAT family N-acetyltransferase n=1 Tax=Amycolatopsis sp. YIM 10 TaxID=2653857 RepID=UPI0012A93646|nr:GNAT family N-acetyltransferase [Amycolatopsis sp. YIM 10]QFU90115.1 Acetyltransferase (GNAT) family protein [Amycolatopsis sp. YIM 10]